MAVNVKSRRSKARTFFGLLFSPSKRRRLQNIKMIRHFNEISKKIDIENYVRKTYAEQRESFGEILSGKHTYHYMIVRIMECMKLPPRTRHIVEQASLDMDAAASYANPLPRGEAITLTRHYLAAFNAIGNDFPSIGIKRAYFLHKAEILENLKALEKDRRTHSLLSEKEAERMYNAFDYMRERALAKEDYKFLRREEDRGMEVLNSF